MATRPRSTWRCGCSARTAAPARSRIPNAVDFLETRRGSAWADELARAATGRLEIGSLRRTATSPTERAELAFYTATLSLGSPPPERVRALLEEVVDSDLILVFEREAARVRLSKP